MFSALMRMLVEFAVDIADVIVNAWPEIVLRQVRILLGRKTEDRTPYFAHESVSLPLCSCMASLVFIYLLCRRW